MDTKKIGAFIAENRKSKKMTQKQLAEILGVTDKTVSRWENGNYMPDLSLLLPLSDALNITLNELLNGERIAQEHIAEKAEASLANTLEYSEQKIKTNNYRIYAIIATTSCMLLLLWGFLNMGFFAEVPHQNGNVSQWEEQYPNHSAFKMGLSRTGKPVFINTMKAMRQAKVIYSDAIAHLQKEYHLLPLSQYTYKAYMTYGWQITNEDEAIIEQGRALTRFLDIYDNCFEWKQLANTKEGRTKHIGEKYSMWDIYKTAFTVMLVPGMLGVMAISLGIYHIFQHKKMKRLPMKTTGVVTGLVKSHLFRNEVHGNVPGSTLIGWGTSQGEQYWGGLLKKRIPPWFPCVSYQANEKEISRIMGEGTWKDTWKTGQNVVILYDPKNPYISFIEGDVSLQKKAKYDIGAGLLLILVSVVSLFLFLC